MFTICVFACFIFMYGFILKCFETYVGDNALFKLDLKGLKACCTPLGGNLVQTVAKRPIEWTPASNAVVSNPVPWRADFYSKLLTPLLHQLITRTHLQPERRGLMYWNPLKCL